MSRYRISPRIVKPWIMPHYLVWEILEEKEVWCDPTYGNGGGDWVKSTFVIGKFTDEKRATEALEALMKYEVE